jgi:SAM-dependent methyltransferase
MMLSIQQIVDRNLLACPRCRHTVHYQQGGWRCTAPDCQYATEPFETVSGLPVLIDFARSVVELGRLRASEGTPPSGRRRLAAVIDQMSMLSNTVARDQVQRMRSELCRESADRPLILVVGGGTVGYGLDGMYSDARIDVMAFDIYVSPVAQFVADAHAIPVADGSVDGVVVQAVLEHVLQPQKVADEIERVLRPNGMVYADTPFMQQVHLNAYDFTRFTDSGHRYLFRAFERVDSGAVAGAGTALRWSVDYFVRALTRSRKLGRIAALSLFWLGFMDRFLDRKHSLDGCSSVFFLGRKAGQRLSAVQAIEYYQGGDGRHRAKEGPR